MVESHNYFTEDSDTMAQAVGRPLGLDVTSFRMEFCWAVGLGWICSEV